MILFSAKRRHNQTGKWQDWKNVGDSIDQNRGMHLDNKNEGYQIGQNGDAEANGGDVDEFGRRFGCRLAGGRRNPAGLGCQSCGSAKRWGRIEENHGGLLGIKAREQAEISRKAGLIKVSD